MLEAELYRRLQELRPVTVAVVGDVILDEYLSGDFSRISPEAPVGVLDCTHDDLKLGGAANVAANFRKMNCRVDLVGITGADQDAHRLKRLLKENGISARGLVASVDRPTIKKSRVMAQHQQLLRIDREKRHAISKEMEAKVFAHFKKTAAKADGIVISDYHKGLLTNALLADIIGWARKNGKPVVVDPKGESFAKYRGASFITPNRHELEKASRVHCPDKAGIEKAARALITEHRIGAVLATLSADGMALFEGKAAGKFFPTVAKEVFDVTGAGDTVVAVFTAAWLGGFLPEEAARLANYAGGLQVAHLGAEGVGLDEIRHTLGAEAGLGESKIVDAKTAAALAENLRKKKHKVVFTNGCFDLLHYGHIQYLQKARALGDRLFLGLNSDASVRRLKGPTRPVVNEHDRAHIMAALDCVDQVIVFGEETPLKLIKAVKPDILVKGGDYTIEGIVGHKEVQSWGGTVKTIKYIEGSSSTGIIKKIVRTNKGN